MHDPGGSTSPLKIFANIFISFVGSGVLGLPYAFMEAGILEGVVIMSFVGFVSVKAMLLLIDCKERLGERPDVRQKFKVVERDRGPETGKLLYENKDEDSNGAVKNGEKTKMNRELTECDSEVQKSDKNLSSEDETTSELDYGDIGYYAVGENGRTIVDVSIVLSQTGFCCAYIIFISENMATIFPRFAAHHWVGIIILPLIGLCMLRHLNKLAIFSLFADFSNVLAYSVVFWFDFENIHTVKKRLHPKEYSLVGFPFFLGIAFYCYEGAGLICYLESSVAAECRSKFRPIFKFVLILVTTLYMAFGICGYLSFGPDTKSIITLNLPPGPMPHLVKGCLCFSLFFTYPVAMFPVVSTIERRIGLDPVKQYRAGNVLRMVMVSTTGFIVLLIPSFTTLMALVGATCCTLLAFVLPGLFHLQVFQGSLSLKGYLFDVLLILLGIVATILGTWDALKRLFPVLLDEGVKGDT